MLDFSGLYRRYAKDVYRFALYLSGNHADAEDITAETFTRVWTTTGEIRAATVKAYLFTIARNLCRESRRRDARRADLHEWLPDPKPGPEMDAAARLQLRAVWDELRELSEPDRAALLMYAVEGFSQAEVAAALGLSLPAVKVKIHRARLRLAALRRGGSHK